MDSEKVLEFARAQGFSNISAATPWQGYEVYEPKVSLMNAHKAALPQMILVKGDKIRMSTPEEAFAYLDFKYPQSQS